MGVSLRLRRIMGFAVAIIAGVYVTLCVIARVAYPRLLFPAPQINDAQRPSVDRLIAEDHARLIELAQANGTKTHVIHFGVPEPRDEATADARRERARTVVLFHGNGETAVDNLDVARKLRAHGLGVLLVEYRGYGTTYGEPPSEAMLYEDGEAAIAFLKNEVHLRPDQIAIWGWSLGSGVASEMAHRGHGARLVLLAPFTSITAMAQRFAPILPVSLLMSHRLDTESKAPSIKIPSLVVHGDLDEVVPFVMGERVAKALPHATFVAVKGGHHTDLFDDPKLVDQIAAHLSE